jgi:tRNA (cmo5U34)-methyltransferase
MSGEPVTPVRQDTVWKSPEVVKTFLTGVRGALPLAREQIDVMLRLLAASGRPVERFLDLGCGDGILGAAVLEAFPKAHGVLADFSPAMLDAAKKRLAAHAARLRFVEIDYVQPDWVEVVNVGGPFDAIVSGFSIHHQPDDRKRLIYRQVFDLLAPGGWFLHLEHVSSPTPWLSQVWDECLVDHIWQAQRKTNPAVSREEAAQTHVHRPDKAANILAPVEAQCDWLRQIGFADVDCYLKFLEMAVFGGRKPDVAR